MKEIDHKYTGEIVCPHCGYVNSDSWENDNNGWEECPECEKPYSWERIVTIEYTTQKEKYEKCERCGKDEVLEKVHTQSKGTNFKMVCEECDDELHREFYNEIN